MDCAPIGETTQAKLNTTKKPQLYTTYLVTFGTFYLVSKVQLIDALAGSHRQQYY